MKKLFLTLSILITLFSFISCNLDSDEGLFQEAGNSSKHENYSNFAIVGKSGDNLMIASDKGIYEYGTSVYKATGVIARNTIYADADHIVFYNDGFAEGPEGYYIFSCANNNSEPLDNPNLEGYVPAGAPYSTDGIHFSLVFKKESRDSDGKITSYEFKVAYSTLTSANDLRTLEPSFVDASSTEKKLTGVTIIGTNEFLATVQEWGSKMNKAASYYTFTADSISFTTKTDEYHWGKAGDVTINHQGVIKVSGFTNVLATDVSITNRVAMFEDTINKRVIVIPASSSNMYIVNLPDSSNPPTMVRVAIPGLNSLYIFAIMSVDGEGNYQVMTSSSGIKTIDLKSETVK